MGEKPWYGSFHDLYPVEVGNEFQEILKAVVDESGKPRAHSEGSASDPMISDLSLKDQVKELLPVRVESMAQLPQTKAVGALKKDLAGKMSVSNEPIKEAV